MESGIHKIPVASPQLTEADISMVSECLRSGWVSGTSPYVEEFERKFAEFCGCKYGVATNSGTSALHLALATLKVGLRNEVIIPTFTMIATANAVTYTNAKPIIVDSESQTWNIDPALISKKVTQRTRVIMPIDTYGHPADMDSIMEIAGKQGLRVVEDAAEAHGGEYKSRRTGSLGDIGCFSFYANKIITTGEGGMLVTNDEELAVRAKWLRAHAFGRGGRHFYHEELGFGYRMSGVQAALGLSQLERIEINVRARRRNARLYNEHLGKLGGEVILPPEANWAKNAYWMYSVLLKNRRRRNELMEWLAKRGIETRTFFYPIHRQPFYKAGYRQLRFPVADMLSRTGVNLPSGNGLSEEEIGTVCDEIRSYFHNN